MIPVCVKPFEDELLYGWLMRLARINGEKSVLKLREKYLERRADASAPLLQASKDRPDIVPDLERICREHESIKCFPDTETIIRKMTPLYALYPFMRYGYQARWVHFILRPDSESGIRPGNSLKPLFEDLRICPDCVREDMEAYGFPYLRTWHHIPGVRVCARHGTVLWHIGIKACRWLDFWEVIERAEDMELMADLKTELRISSFLKDLYEVPVFMDLIGLQEMLRKKIQDLGYEAVYPYDELVEWLKDDGTAYPFREGMAKKIRNLLNCKILDPSMAAAFTAMLFKDAESFKQVAAGYVSDKEDDFQEMISGRYDMLSGYGQTVRLGCKKCGTVFYIHPEAIFKGCFCPDCEKAYTKEQLLSHRLSFLGDGKYTLLNGTDEGVGNAKILHETCGKIRTMRLSDAVWMGRRCDCEDMLSEAEIRERVDSVEYRLVGLKSGKRKPVVKMLHRPCGHTFESDMGSFIRNRRCPYCDFRNVAARDEEDFRQAIKDLTGDEYELVGPFSGGNAPVLIRHRVCGTVTEMTPVAFINGKRCRLCGIRAYGREELQRMVREYTGGHYRILGGDGEGYEVIGDDGSRSVRRAAFIVQELARPTDSAFFKVRVQRYTEDVSPRCVLYKNIKEATEKKGVWTRNDLTSSVYSKWGLNIALKWLASEGYVESIRYGEYKVKE